MKVCLAVLKGSSIDNFSKYGRENLGIGYIGAVLEKNGFKVEIIDAFLNRYSLKQVIERMGDIDFDVLGISLFHQFKDALKLMAYVKAKKPDVHISVGGHYAASCYEKVLNGISLIDSVNLGEGEKTFLDLCRKINSKEDWRSILGLAYRNEQEIVCNAMPDLVKDLDELPFPLRDIRGEVSILSISLSRGCYGQCSFCDVNSFYKRQPGEKVRIRSAVNVVDEIEMLVKKHHVNKFKFVDDNFLSNTVQRKQWALDIADEIKNRNLKINFLIECRASDVDENTILRLKEAGLNNVFLGIESITPRILRVFNKNISPKENYEAISIIKKCGIGMTIGYILIEPHVVFEEIIDNLKFLSYISYWEFAKFDQVPVSLLEPLRLIEGTYLYEEALQEGIIDPHAASYDTNLQYKLQDGRVESLREFLDVEWIPFYRENYEKINNREFSIDESQRKELRTNHLSEVLVELVKLDLRMWLELTPLFLEDGDGQLDKRTMVVDCYKSRLEDCLKTI